MSSDEATGKALLEEAALVYRGINSVRELMDTQLREWDNLLMRIRATGMTYTDMGRALGTSEAAMRVAVKRARKANEQ